MKDVQTVKDSAKSFIGDLIRNGRWKKEAARNQTAFPTNSQGGGNSSDKTLSRSSAGNSHAAKRPLMTITCCRRADRNNNKECMQPRDNENDED